MLSYKQWKTLNESVLPSFSLGLGRPSSLGLVSQFGFDEMKMAEKKAKKKMDDGEIVKAKRKADKPDVEVDVDGKDSEEMDVCGKCGSMCGSMSKKHSEKHCKLCMKSKKKMWSDEDDRDEEEAEGDQEEAEGDEEEAEGEEEEAKAEKKKAEADEEEADEDEDEEEANEAYSKKHMDSEEDEESDDEEDEDEDESEDDHEEGHDKEDHHDHDHDHEDEEGDEEAEAPKMAKKKMLKGGQHKLDVNKDGKISGEDFKLMHKMKKGKKGKKHHDDKHEQTEEEAWWNSVRSMIGPSDAKYSDGFFSILDTDNLYQHVRSED